MSYLKNLVEQGKLLFGSFSYKMVCESSCLVLLIKKVSVLFCFEDRKIDQWSIR